MFKSFWNIYIIGGGAIKLFRGSELDYKIKGFY